MRGLVKIFETFLLERCLIILIMLKQTTAIIAFALLAGGSLCLAQEKTEKNAQTPAAKEEQKEMQKRADKAFNQPPALPIHMLGSVQQLKLSPEKNAWAVQIISSGGFNGAGKGNLIVTSEGSLSWKALNSSCSASLAPEALSLISQAALATNPSKWGASSVSLCMDCYVTTVVLHRREADGTERIYSVYWDDTTKAKVPEEVMKIYETFMAQGQCKN